MDGTAFRVEVSLQARAPGRVIRMRKFVPGISVSSRGRVFVDLDQVAPADVDLVFSRADAVHVLATRRPSLQNPSRFRTKVLV